MLGSRKATVTNIRSTPIPIVFTTTMNTVKMLWIRTGRLLWLSQTRPSSHEP